MSGTAYPYRGRALMKYRPPPQPGQSAEQAAQQFAFAKGDTVTVIGQADDEGDWLQGEKDGVEGVFPAGFVEKIEQEEEEESVPAPAAALAAEPKEAVATTATQSTTPEETVKATPSDPVNVTEAQDSAPPVKAQHTSLREPEAPVKEPTLADVTPASTANLDDKLSQPVQATPSEPKSDSALTSPGGASTVDSPVSSTATPKAVPPSPAKKPNALASRIAAFQAAAASQAAEPPVPKPKPKQWTRPAAPPAQAVSPGVASDGLKSPGLALPAAPAPAPTAVEGAQSEGSGERREFSAQDAQASISRGGGSLRDRIKALQGGGAGGMGAQVDPAAKPWKKPSNTDDVEAAPASTSADAESSSQAENPEDNLREAVVLDSPPAVEHRTAEEPQSDIPGFEPAEEDEPAAENANDAAKSTVGEEAVAEPLKDLDDPVSAVSPRSAELASSAGADESSTATAVAGSSGDAGGQRLGVPMPALPKRAAGPRARKAKSPAATSPAATERTEESTMRAPAESVDEASTAANAQAPVAPPAAENDGSNDILASMGGVNKLLADDDDDEDSRPKAPVDDDDDFDTPAAPPPMPSVRPPIPKTQRSFEDPVLEKGEEELPVEQYISREEEGEPQQTIAEEAVDALPSTDEPAVATAEEPMSPSRPPLPPPFIRQHSQPEERDVEEEPAPPMPPARHPPIPTHPPPGDNELMTTAAENAFLDKQPDVVTPPEEAADESTATPTANAPSIAEIMQGRQEAGAHPAEMAQPAFGKMEGTATPAVEQAPPMFAATQAQQAPDGGSAEAGEDDEEEEEEDPEVARRRALAARMAKLGGRGPLMGGPMLGLGGLPPKKPTKKKSTSTEPTEPATEANLESQAIDPASGSGLSTPDAPQRRAGGPPLGGFALPGIVPSRPKEPETQTTGEEDRAPKEPAELDLNDKIALSGDELARRSAAATDEAFKMTDAQRVADSQQQSSPDEAAAEEHDDAPPPRPATGPPSRSVPPPVEADEEEGEEAAEGGVAYAHEQEEHFDEPESYAAADETVTQEEPVEDDEMPPPPPPRPTGGHQASLPPPARAAPGSPSASATPSSPRFSGLNRSATTSSKRSISTFSSAGGAGAAISPRQSVDAQFEPARMQGGAPVGGAFLARDIDLDTAQPWWRSQGAVPRSLQGRYDVLVDLSENSSTKRGKTTIEKEIEVIYPDYSKTLVTVSFVGDDAAESATAISQAHYPPSMKPNLDALLQWSASLGAQVFAAAHTKMGDKSARGQSDADLIRFCYGRATDPLMPIGGTFGVKVYKAVVEQGKKAPMVGEDDEPRAGDIVAISAKFKHNLSSKIVGSEANGPHLAVVAGWEAKKGKLRVIEVESKNGSVDENTYRVDEMRAGSLIVYRVAPRDFIV